MVVDVRRFRFRFRFAGYGGGVLGFILAGVTDHRLVGKVGIAVHIGSSGVGRGGQFIAIEG